MDYLCEGYRDFEARSAPEVLVGRMMNFVRYTRQQDNILIRPNNRYVFIEIFYKNK